MGLDVRHLGGRAMKVTKMKRGYIIRLSDSEYDLLSNEMNYEALGSIRLSMKIGGICHQRNNAFVAKSPTALEPGLWLPENRRDL